MAKLLRFPIPKIQKCVFCDSYHNPEFDCLAKVYTLALMFADDSEKMKLFDCLGSVEESTLQLILVPRPDND